LLVTQIGEFLDVLDARILGQSGVEIDVADVAGPDVRHDVIGVVGNDALGLELDVLDRTERLAQRELVGWQLQFGDRPRP
jgi:hypothetical protein